MIKHVFFDMDGTLTPSRQTIEPQVAFALRKLSTRRDVIIVSGARDTQILKQMPDAVVYTRLSQNGNMCMQHVRDILWHNELNWEQKYKVFALVKHMIIGKQYKSTADLVEDRGCQISFSGTGHNAPLEEKRAFDPDGSRRSAMMQESWGWFRELEQYRLKCAIGGTTCIDFYRHTKGENVGRYVAEQGWIPAECLYVGDALFKGGNDETVIGYVPVHRVNGPADTHDLIRKLVEEV